MSRTGHPDDERLPDDVAAVLHRRGLPPDRIVLEITETAILGAAIASG